MNRYRRFISSIVVLICLSIPRAFLNGQDICSKAKSLSDLINEHHLEPQKTDDQFSERIFSRFLKLLDADAFFFTKKDSVALSVFRNQIDDQILSGKCTFLRTTSDLYKQKVISYQRFADSLLQRPMNFSSNESVDNLFSTTENFENDSKTLAKKRVRDFKYRVLSRAWKIAESKNEALSENNFPAQEKIAREKVRQRTNRQIDHLLKQSGGIDLFVEDAFLKAISLSFDPHTEFFTPEEMKKFEMGLSTTGLSFGFDLQETQTGELQISRLTPGGPAWKSQVLKSGDVLVSLKFGNELIETSDFEPDEIIERLVDVNSSSVEVTVKKPDGMLKSIMLQKEKVENIENLISSFILEDSRKVGYISLPGFYTNQKDLGGRGCAGDVAKEIIKLKKDGIEGLILDLRFNGGGSVQEALDLAGIFIDIGPLAVFEQKGGQLITLKDANRGSVYNGPLVIMVNAMSASASELVAAGLRDYNRAVVIGCTSYGKATGQIVLPAETTGQTWGYAKITEDRIFRIDGNSLQLTGVIPDISFPELTESLIPRERVQAFALPPKTISKKIYFTPLPAISLTTIRAASSNRTGSSEYFKNTERFGRALKSNIPLEVKKFILYMSDLERLSANLSSTNPEQGTYKVYSSNSDKTLLTVDTYHRELSEDALKTIRKSSYILEAYNIVNDLLKSSKP